MTSSESAFDRFARSHLATRAERAVYTVVAGGPTRQWTARVAATAAGVSNREADQALRSFAAAGIVDHVRGPGQPHRFQWRPGMPYVRGGDFIASENVDPVCAMLVPADMPHTVRDGHGEIRFCSLRCLVQWQSARRRGRGRRQDMVLDQTAGANAETVHRGSASTAPGGTWPDAADPAVDEEPDGPMPPDDLLERILDAIGRERQARLR
jgi:hypothetical protein